MGAERMLERFERVLTIGVRAVLGATLALLCLSLSSSVAGGAPTAPPSSAPSIPTAASPAARPGAEVVAERGRSSRTYATDDGRGLMTRVFAGPVHYRAGDGSWQTIDNALEASGSSFRNKANSYQAALPDRLGAGRQVSVSEAGDRLDFSLRDAAGAGAVDGAQITYADALPGVDVRYQARAESLKELLVLRARTARRQFVFDLELSDGLAPQLLSSGAIAVRDRSGVLAMSIPAPFMYDAKGAESSKVDVALAQVRTGWRLTITPDASWLDASARSFPVTVDPQVFPNNHADCTLDQSAPTTDTCASGSLLVGGAAGAERRSVLRFDIAGGVPYGATITHAALGLQVVSQSASTAKLVRVHQLTQAFGSSATWTTPWSGGQTGGVFSAAVACEQCSTVGGPAGGGGVQPGNRAYWSIRDTVEGWYRSPASNNGMLLKVDSITSDGNLLTFGSAESANQPFVDVRFEQRSGLLRGHKYETQQLTDRMAVKVNAAAGNLWVGNREFTVPGGVGPDLTVSRSYNSKRRDMVYSFGKGWSMDTGPDVRLERTPVDDVVFHGPTGTDVLFERNPDGSYKTPVGFDAKLVAPVGGGWTYTENQSQRKMTFDSSGRLTRDEDRNGRALTFTYVGSSSQLSKITDVQGRDTTFTYTSGRISQITDSGGRLYKYFYDGSGRLTKYTDPELGDTLYDYATDDSLQLITTPAGHKTKITYYPSGAAATRVASVIRATNPGAVFGSLTGPTTAFEYTITGYAASPPTTWPEQSVVRDALYPGTGSTHSSSTNFDKDSLPLETRDGLGRLTKNSYTANANVMTFTLAANTGTTPNTTLSYDPDENPTKSVTPASSPTAACSTASSSDADCLMSSAGYATPTTVLGNKYLPSSQTDTEGKATTLTYDVKGNPKTIAKGSSTTTLTYDTTLTGKLTKITDAKGNDTLYGYDTASNLTTITPKLPLGATTLTYTANISRIATVKDGMTRTRTLSYDNLDRVTKITYSDGSYVQFVYDKDGNLTAQNDSVNGNTTATYDELSRVLSQTKPGVTTSYTYDAAGNLKTIQDPGGTTTYAYNDANENISVQEPGVSGAIAFSYDADGLREKVTYPNGVKVLTRYDDANRTTRIFSTRNGGEQTTDAFQDSSYTWLQGATQRAQRQSTTDVLASRTTGYEYDGLNRLDLARTYTAGGVAPTGSCITSPALACWDYGLDAVGNRTALQVRGSTLTSADYTMAYNAANQLCWKKPAVVASPTCATVPSGASVYTYDADGNQTSNGAGRTLTYSNRDQTTSLAGTNATYLGAGQNDLTALGTTSLRNDLVGASTRTSGGTASYYARALDGTILSQRTGTSAEYYSQDILGSVTATTTQATGAPAAATYAYDPDGNTTTTGTSTNPFKYIGGYAAPGELTHFGQRYYDPADARWSQVDPLDQATDLLEANRYGYAGGDPVNLTDPSGTDLCNSLIGSGCGETLDKVTDTVYKGAEVGIGIGATCLAAVVTAPACLEIGAYSGSAGVAACTLQGFRKARAPRSIFGGKGCAGLSGK